MCGTCTPNTARKWGVPIIVFFLSTCVCVLVYTIVWMNNVTKTPCMVVDTYVLTNADNERGFYGIFVLLNNGTPGRVHTPPTLIVTPINNDSIAVIYNFNVSSVHRCFYNKHLRELWLKQPNSARDFKYRRIQFIIMITLVSAVLAYFPFTAAKMITQTMFKPPDTFDPRHVSMVSLYNQSSIDNFSNNSCDEEDIIYIQPND